MADLIPAMRGEFGTFEYWITTMHVGDLVKSITIPKDVDGWDDISIEERYQRDININRVKKEIAPYFANDDSRFSSAIILAVQNHEGMTFEPLQKFGVSDNLPQLYVSAAEDIGFLTFSGGEVFIPLDGQHRAKAFEYAIRGTDDNNKPIEKIAGNASLANEDVPVILVRFASEPSRRIFNKVNRYAKPTGKGQNLLTDDDDAIAVITRRIISGEANALIPSDLVRWQSNTLSAIAREFTTLATLYDANILIADQEPSPGKQRPKDAATDELKEFYEDKIREVWEHLLGCIEIFREALLDKDESGDDRRREIREEMLLGKPIGQLVLVEAFLDLRKRRIPVPGSPSDSYWQTDTELCARLNKIDWSLRNPQWRGVLTNEAGRVLSGKTTARLAALFVVYLCGAQLTEDERTRLREHIWGADTDRELPAPVA